MVGEERYPDGPGRRGKSLGFPGYELEAGERILLLISVPVNEEMVADILKGVTSVVTGKDKRCYAR